jgi:hypothetical protein
VIVRESGWEEGWASEQSSKAPEGERSEQIRRAHLEKRVKREAMNSAVHRQRASHLLTQTGVGACVIGLLLYGTGAVTTITYSDLYSSLISFPSFSLLGS